MFKIKIADLVIGIESVFPFTEEICRDYITADGEPDFSVSVSSGQIKAEDGGEGFADDYLESLAIYRVISEKIIDYDGFLMHGVVLALDGKGYVFTAPSGTGKTTHAMYWKQLFGDRCTIVNGDKPLIRFMGGECYAYGTPWCGKENLNANMRIKLTDFYALSRAEENSVKPLDPRKALIKLLTAVYRPSCTAAFEKTTEYIFRFIDKVRVWDLCCNMSADAAKTAYRAAISESSN